MSSASANCKALALAIREMSLRASLNVTGMVMIAVWVIPWAPGIRFLEVVAYVRGVVLPLLMSDSF